MVFHDLKLLKKLLKYYITNWIDKKVYCEQKMTTSTHQAMSKTGPLCPPTRGTSGFSLPTLAWGRIRKAPPPPDSTITATNFGLTAQNVESHELLDTLKTLKSMQKLHTSPN